MGRRAGGTGVLGLRDLSPTHCREPSVRQPAETSRQAVATSTIPEGRKEARESCCFSNPNFSSLAVVAFGLHSQVPHLVAQGQTLLFKSHIRCGWVFLIFGFPEDGRTDAHCIRLLCLGFRRGLDSRGGFRKIVAVSALLLNHACIQCYCPCCRQEKERDKESILEAKSKSMNSLSLSQWSFAFCLSN